MLLRPRQEDFVKRSIAALKERGNTLAVAATGFGKTIALSAVVGKHLRQNENGKAVIIAHRDEITDQNIKKFKRVNPEINASIYDADRKDWTGDAVFAMVQTLCRQNNLDTMPAPSLLVCDETHHIVSDSYMRVVDHVKKLNDKCLIYGVTATPSRGDKKGLRAVFDNVADQVFIKELIDSGHLVRPRPFVIDLGVQNALMNVKKTISDFDMGEVEQIMNSEALNDKIVEHWKDKTGGRKTIVFCSTIAHSIAVCKTFRKFGVLAQHLDGETPDAERSEILRDLAHGKTEVVCNVAVLTEGTDIPPVSCICLLRPCSYKSTMIQMVGRGLRTVDPEEYPHVNKSDCIILDFGTSLLTHGSIEQEACLDGAKDGAEPDPDNAPKKNCPECEAQLPIAVGRCPFCGHIFENEGIKGVLENFAMSEVDIFKKSNFKWISIDDEETCMMAAGFTAWAGAFYWGDKYFAIGGMGRQVKLLGSGERVVAISLGEDHMNNFEEEDAAHKTKSWLRQPATDKQLAMLGKSNLEGLTKYRASCEISLNFNKQKVIQLIRAA